MVYRRTDREMTCYDHEYDFARKEGIEFPFSVAAFAGDAGQRPSYWPGMSPRRVRRSGRVWPAVAEAIGGSEFVLAADQSSKPSARTSLRWPHSWASIQRRGSSSWTQVFRPAGLVCTHWRLHSLIGRCVNRHAVQDGKLAAAAIHQQLAQRRAFGRVRYKSWQTLASISRESSLPTHSGWPRPRPPTPARKFTERLKQAGVGRCGNHRRPGAQCLESLRRWHYGRPAHAGYQQRRAHSPTGPSKSICGEIAEVKRRVARSRGHCLRHGGLEAEAWREIVERIERHGR